MTAYDFNNSEYRLGHRKDPRGTQVWWFKCNGVQYRAPEEMPYSKAKQWIAKELKRNLVSIFYTVYPMP